MRSSKFIQSVVPSVLVALMAHACVTTEGDDPTAHTPEPCSTTEGADDYYTAAFEVTLEGTADGRLDKYGNACRIAATFIAGDGESCSVARRACAGREDTGLMRVMDPWRPDEYIDVPCPKLVDLSCSCGADVDGLVGACERSLAGKAEEDPLFVSPVSLACGVFATFGTFGANWNSALLFPSVPADTTALWSFIPSLVGLFGCALIPF